VIRLTTITRDVVNTDASVDHCRRLSQEALSKSPTSSPVLLERDFTITTVLPFLTTILPTSGSHNSSGFLLRAFAYFLGLRRAIATRNDADDSDKLRLQKAKDMVNLTSMIRGIPGHQSAEFHFTDCSIIVPTYRLSEVENDGQRPTLNLAKIRLLPTFKGVEGCVADILLTEVYEWMLHVLISHILLILGSDCVPVVMRPVITDGLREYIEPLTRLGNWDSIEFPAVGGKEKPRFRLLGLSDQEVRRRRWVRGGKFGWGHIPEGDHRNSS
jgi:hypothetical protein